MALKILIDKLIKSLDRGEYVIGIFLYFSKAFDTVDHEILLYIVYINDLCSVCEYSTPILFADDTNLFCSGKT